MVRLTRFVLDCKYTVWAKLVQNRKMVCVILICPEINGRGNCFFFKPKEAFLCKFVPKTQNCLLKLNKLD